MRFLRWVVLLGVLWLWWRRRPPSSGSGQSAAALSLAAARQLLGVPANASPDQIKEAYQMLIQQYHPDKVAHLGDDIQRLALERTQQLNLAYKRLQAATKQP